MKMDNRLRSLFTVLIILPLMAGCARTVTQLNGEQPKMVSFDITYVGTMDTTGTGYYIIFSNSASSAASVPFLPYEFIKPGAGQPIPNPPLPSGDYYSNYYSTWQNYIDIDQSQFVLSPYTSEAVPTPEPVTISKALAGNEITLTFDISTEAPYGSRIWFDIVTVDNNTDLVEDNLSYKQRLPSTYYFYTKSGTLVTGSDESLGPKNASDILSWRVYVQ